MPKDPPPDVQELAQLLLLQPTSGGGRGRRSPLWWWMFERSDALRPIFARTRTTWANVAAALPDIPDTTDGSGKRPTGERVRKTWFEVCQAKGWATKANRPSPSPTLPADPSPLPPVTPTPTAAEAPEPDFGFRFAGGPKDWTKKTN
jgi:hypothetical protein